MNKTIDINEIAKDLGLTRQNLNYHINKGRAGNVEKNGYARTSSLIIEPKNVIELIEWLGAYGRSDKLLLDLAYNKYIKLVDEE